jgi:hypothetical protein
LRDAAEFGPQNRDPGKRGSYYERPRDPHVRQMYRAQKIRQDYKSHDAESYGDFGGHSRTTEHEPLYAAAYGVHRYPEKEEQAQVPQLAQN